MSTTSESIPTPAAARPGRSSAQWKRMLRMMITIREFEHLGEQEFRNGLIRGYYHSYAGQEAVGVGMLEALDPGHDYIVDHYRDHGHCLAMGIDAEQVFAELFGRRTGVSKGKGGSMHMYSPDKHFLGGDGIVGGGISVAAGVGMALKRMPGKGLCVCFFGDGALDTGTFHESLNLASLWDLPVVFVCINNQYSMGTSLQRHSSLSQLVDRASGYGMSTEQIDGQDVGAVHSASERIFAAVRERQRPCFIEALTYRYQGHGIHDKPLNYRTTEEEEPWRRRDPIRLLSEKLIEERQMTPAQIEKMRQEVTAELEAKAERARQAPAPEARELFDDVMI